MTAKQAQETNVFVIVPSEYEYYTTKIGTKEFKRSKPVMWQIEETSLYDHVMASAEETTSPRGVENKMHIRENEEKGTFEVWDWGFRGQYPRLVETFESDEEAEDFIFEKTEEYDFNKDDQRDTSYYYSYEEAHAELVRIYADNNYLDIPVAESILKKQCKINNIRAERELIARKEQTKLNELRRQRIQELAPVYAKLIEKKTPETFKETCTRLSQAIGKKIERDVFFAAVKIVRK